MKIFNKQNKINDFSYLKEKDIYFDSACQSLRPEPVIKALEEYYYNFNSCGERVKYQWGKTTDEKVSQTRQKILEYLKIKRKDYFVSFTLNTTYGINLILSQINVQKAKIKYIVTSDIEHNSPFLSTITFAKRNKIERIVLSRNNDGSINLSEIPKNALVVINAVSNVDGRELKNIRELEQYVAKNKGFLIIDAAQAMAHQKEILEKTTADAICFSAHKMYAPSLGAIVMRRDFVQYVDTGFIGGGMVDDVFLDRYLLSSDNKEHLYTKFEAGLQSWGEIIALGQAIEWLKKISKNQKRELIECEQRIFNFFKEHGEIGVQTMELEDREKSTKKLHLLNNVPSSTFSFYIDGINSHLLGEALADEGIMVRTGYFCVHYYLDHKKHFPPLVRVSLGYHNTVSQVEHFLSVLRKVL